MTLPVNANQHLRSIGTAKHPRPGCDAGRLPATHGHETQRKDHSALAAHQDSDRRGHKAQSHPLSTTASPRMVDAGPDLTRVPLSTMRSWREDIVGALHALGGSGNYEEIYAEVAARRATLPTSWQEIIRRTIQQASSDSAGHRPSTDDLFYALEGIGKGIWGLRPTSVHDAAPTGTGIAQNPETAQGYVADSVIRTAIEIYAVEAAEEHYMSRGARDIERVGKPYDLRLLIGDREVHVEVKGSTRRLTSVILTRNEVDHARGTTQTDLFVVDEISLQTSSTGEPRLAGGRKRHWSAWSPSPDDLSPTVYSYTLPTQGR